MMSSPHVHLTVEGQRANLQMLSSLLLDSLNYGKRGHILHKWQPHTWTIAYTEGHWPLPLRIQCRKRHQVRGGVWRFSTATDLAA